MQIVHQKHSSPQLQTEEEESKAQELQLVIFPKKFLNPFLSFRMYGDFHLYTDAKHIQINEAMKLGISCQNRYKKISKIVVDREAEKLILHYTQLDFTQTPWEYVVKRLKSFGDVQMNKLSEYIQQYYEHLNQGLNTEIQQKISKDSYRAAASFQYRYIKDIDQFFISQMSYDLCLIEDLGFSIPQFVESCMKVGIPEFSLKQGCTNEEYYKNVIEFAKPLTNPHEPQDFNLYSHLYPQGLRTTVAFNIQKEVSLIEGESLVNFNFYLNYTPSLRNNVAIIPPKKLKTLNCISYYYDLMDHHYSRCGFKKTKLDVC